MANTPDSANGGPPVNEEPQPPRLAYSVHGHDLDGGGSSTGSQRQDQPLSTTAGGTPDGRRPVLFIHGMLAGQPYWQVNLTTASPPLTSVCTPVTVDLWGHGASPSPLSSRYYQPSGLADALDAVRQAVGIDRWVAVGHSLGAAVALAYWRHYPNRVSGLVVTNSRSAFAPDRASLEHEAHRMADAVNRRGMAAFDRSPLHPANAKNMHPEVRAALLAAVAQHSAVGIERLLRHTVASTSAIGWLDAVTVPVLLTWGIYEKRFAPIAQDLMARAPHWSVARLEAGHGVNLGDPDGFNQAVAQFLQHID